MLNRALLLVTQQPLHEIKTGGQRVGEMEVHEGFKMLILQEL
jgi:hypothetical protein